MEDEVRYQGSALSISLADKKESRIVMLDYDPAELEEIRDDLTKELIELHAQEKALKAYNSAKREQIKELKKSVAEKVESLKSGQYEDRAEVYTSYDHDTNTATEYLSDGTILAERRMTQSEKSQPIPMRFDS